VVSRYRGSLPRASSDNDQGETDSSVITKIRRVPFSVLEKATPASDQGGGQNVLGTPHREDAGDPLTSRTPGREGGSYRPISFSSKEGKDSS